MKLVTFLLIVTTLCGVTAGSKEKRVKNELTGDALSAGYSLFYKLLSDEKDVSKILIIKKERPELHEIVKRISKAAGTAHKTLEREAKRHGINIENEQLPAAEVAVRESISKEKARELLAAKGDDFQFKLLGAQHEALTYAIHLAKVLGELEKDASLREFLAQTGGELEELRDQVVKLFRATP